MDCHCGGRGICYSMLEVLWDCLGVYLFLLVCTGSESCKLAGGTLTQSSSLACRRHTLGSRRLTMGVRRTLWSHHLFIILRSWALYSVRNGMILAPAEEGWSRETGKESLCRWHLAGKCCFPRARVRAWAWRVEELYCFCSVYLAVLSNLEGCLHWAADWSNFSCFRHIVIPYCMDGLKFSMWINMYPAHYPKVIPFSRSLWWRPFILFQLS